MILRITFTYFNGKKQDHVNMRDIDYTPARAAEYVAGLAMRIQDAIHGNKTLTIHLDKGGIMLTPALLSNTHIEFELVNE